MKEFRLGRFAGLHLGVMPSAFVGSLILWIGLSVLAISLLHFSWPMAIGMGFIATLLHWSAETLHQLGHAVFARRTGYPMRGIRYWGTLSSSVYPPDEPPLTGPTHIRRALGGPVASFLMALLGGLLFIVLSTLSVSDALRWLAFFFLIDNLVVFCLGALLPLGFTDGSTLLRWWGKP
jgi:hypothetical protein